MGGRELIEIQTPYLDPEEVQRIDKFQKGCVKKSLASIE